MGFILLDLSYDSYQRTRVKVANDRGLANQVKPPSIDGISPIVIQHRRNSATGNSIILISPLFKKEYRHPFRLNLN